MGRSRFTVAPIEQRRTTDGQEFDSRTELVRYTQLLALLRAKLITEFERQPAFPVEINNHHYCTYTADFRYRDVDSGEVIVEDVKTKGTEKDAAYRLRKKAAELYYGVEIRAVDRNGNSIKKPRKSLTKKTKTVK